MAKINSPSALHKIWNRVNGVYDKAPTPDKPPPAEMEKLKRKVANGLLKLKNQSVQLKSQPDHDSAEQFLKQRDRLHAKMLRLCQLLKRNRAHEDAKRFPKYFQRIKAMTATVADLDPAAEDFDIQIEVDDQDLDGLDVTGVEQALDRPDLTTAADDEEDELAAGPSASTTVSNRGKEKETEDYPPRASVRDKGKEKQTEDSPSSTAVRDKGKEKVTGAEPSAPAGPSNFQLVQKQFKDLLPHARSCELHPQVGSRVQELIKQILEHLQRHQTAPAAEKMDTLAGLIRDIPADERIWHGVMDEDAFSDKDGHDDKEAMQRFEQEAAARSRQREEKQKAQEQKAKEEREKWEQQIDMVDKKLQERGLYTSEVTSQLQLARNRVARGENPSRELHELGILIKAAKPEHDVAEYRRQLDAIPLPTEGEVSASMLDRLNQERKELALLIERGSEDPEPQLILFRRYTAEVRDTFARRDEFEKELAAITFPEGLAPGALARLNAMRDELRRFMDSGTNPRAGIDELKEAVNQAKANKALEDACISRLARIPSPKGITTPQAKELEEMRTAINKAVDAGEDARPMLDRLEARVREVEQVNAGRDEFQNRLAGIAKPAGMTVEQAAEIEERATGINQAIDAGKDPEPLLDQLQARIREMEQINARHPEFVERFARLPKPQGTHTPAQVKLQRELRDKIQKAIATGNDPGPNFAKFEEYIERIERVNAQREEFEKQLDALRDPPGRTESQASQLRELRKQVSTDLDEGKEPEKSLAALRSYIKEVRESIERPQKQKLRLEAVADAQGKWLERLEARGATAKQLARLLRLRRHIEYLFEEGGDPEAFLARLEKEVNNFDQVNADRKRWEAELKAIALPADLPPDKLALAEDLRLEAMIEIEEGFEPVERMRQLRELVGAKQVGSSS